MAGEALRKIHEPISPYASSVYNSLITVIQGFALAALLWSIAEKPQQGPSIYESLVSAVNAHELGAIPYGALVKIVIVFLGIITLWHSYVINAQFQSYSLTKWDTVIPFFFAAVELLTIASIQQDDPLELGICLVLIEIIGILAYWNMKRQMEKGGAQALLCLHFGAVLGRDVYRVLIDYASRAKTLLIRCCVLMLIALILIGISRLGRGGVTKYAIDLAAIGAIYSWTLVCLARHDLAQQLRELKGFGEPGV